MTDTSDTLYRIKYSGDIKLNTYAEMLIDHKMLVPVQKCVHGSYSEHRLADGGWCYGAMLDHEPSFIGPVG